MVAPTPETRTSIVLLSWSKVKPSGTLKAPPISIQANSAAVMPDCVKIKQLHVKLTSTAAIEIKLLTGFHRSVNSVMTAALNSGASRTIHGKDEFIGLVARESRELTRMVQRDASEKSVFVFVRRVFAMRSYSSFG